MLRFVYLLIFLFSFKSLALADPIAISRKFTVEANPLKCAGRLATWALDEVGFSNDPINFRITKTKTPNQFMLDGEMYKNGFSNHLTGLVKLEVDPILNGLDQPTGKVSCTFPEGTRAPIFIRNRSTGEVLMINPLLKNASSETKCFFVSGLSHDYNNSFKDYKPYVANGPLQFKHYSCKKVGSWSSVERELKLQDIAAHKNKRTPPIRRVLVIQGAHGNSGGDASCDSGEIDGSKIFDSQLRISRKYPLTSFIDSCFSGDLIARKLLYDRKYPKDPSIKNLCMMSTSAFARASPDLSVHNKSIAAQFANASPESYSGNDYFRSLDSLLLSSSSPWEESGVIEKLRLVAKDSFYDLYDFHWRNENYIKMGNPPEKCSKILQTLRRQLWDIVGEGWRLKPIPIEDLQEIEILLKAKECHAQSFVTLFNYLQSPEKSFAQPNTMSAIFDATTWSEMEFTHGHSPFDFLSREWSLRTMNYSRQTNLDIVRNQACEFK